MDGNPKQLIVERIKGVTNILVTVSRDPSVDELAAALALTLMLNKMDKHATAVFSGVLPPAISFLEPSRTFENTVDSLRDFIIALDKEKADRLRYKVEDDVVRIFITPYRTTITQNDLQFSQGDFNVELIIALGVEKREDIDTAIAAHGRILHDATVVTINAENQAGTSSLGSIDWNDGGASSLCEMLMSLSEALQSGLLDQQIASSLLTGIVAATDRFSNLHTTPKVMTMSAQLMAAGANQQLIAAKIEESEVAHPSVAAITSPPNAPQSLLEGNSAKVNKQQTPAPPFVPDVPPAQKANGEMHVSHEDTGLPKPVQDVSLPTPAYHPEPQDEAPHIVTPPTTVPVPAPFAPLDTPSFEEIGLPPQPKSAGDTTDATALPVIGKAKALDWQGPMAEPPRMGGTLNATASEAEQDKMREERSSRNHTILSHGAPVNGARSVNDADEPDDDSLVDPFAAPFSYEETERADMVQKPKVVYPVATPEPTPEPAFEPPVPVRDDEEATPESPPTPPASSPDRPPMTIAELEQQAHERAAMSPNSLDDARAAVDAALLSSPAIELPTTPQTPDAPQPNPQQQSVQPPRPDFGVTLPPPPPMPDFSTLPPLPPAPGEVAEPQPVQQASVPAFPQFPVQSSQDVPAPASSDPTQFRIPGQ